MKLQTGFWLIVMALCGASAADAPLPAEYERIKSEAEDHYAAGSYALANKSYQQAVSLELPAGEKRWLEFRLADTQWRAAAATQNADTTALEQARKQLEVLVRDISRVEDRDRVWAEVEESLGDFNWTQRNQHNWGAAWPFYQQALDWWAGAADLELAAKRYVRMVWKLAKPPGSEPYYSYGAWGNMLPLEVLENTLKIVTSEDDKAHAHYLVAMTLRNQGGDWDQRARVPEEFEAALKGGKATDWHDDALYQYGEWMLSQGRAVQLQDGTWTQAPDYVRALALFRLVVAEYKKGESRYWEQAQQQIASITNPQLNVSVANVFMPGSEIQYQVTWRNVKRIDFALYPVELNRDLHLQGQTHWMHCIELSRSEKIKSWSHDTEDRGEYKPGNFTQRMDGQLKPGAYILEAKAGGNSARELVLVTDATLVLKSSGKQALVWFCNVLSGEPLGGAKIKLSERWHENGNTHVHETELSADTDGVAKFELRRDAGNNGIELFASAILKDRQAFSTGGSYENRRNQDPWKIYAYTDRPAYRPAETAQWKLVARRYNGSVYSTPSDQTIEFTITDPRGAKVKEGKVQLNQFGSAWGAVELTEQMPLGQYQVQFWDNGRKQYIGAATLFRLEEYKLPEFRVKVQTPEESGRKKAFRLGEKVEAQIQADYYFGGPVANATVEVLVYQNPFYHIWHAPREYPWLYEDMDAGGARWNRWYGGQGQIIKRETIKTDGSGKASLVFETPRGGGQDLEYRIEARVTDSSRREIVGSGTVRVTRQRYYVYANPAHNLYRPQEKVQVNFQANDANDQPVQTTGLVKVTRDYWYEIWIDPDGKEVKGEELKKLRGGQQPFPPPRKPGMPGWTLKFSGYEHDEVQARSLKTDTNGTAELSFTPEQEGYYRVAWSSQDTAAGEVKGKPSSTITAETTVWVATRGTTELGYRHGGVEIILDKDTFRAGQKAPIMVVVPANDRHVLFTVEGEDLYSYQVVHLEGTVKLLELDITEQHVPNIFLGAVLVSDRQVFFDSKQVVVPPTKNFVTVELEPDRSQYQPREEGLFTVTTHDYSGKPVSTEVSLGVVDEAVYYIQQDYAEDPRKFFFGTKRPQLVQTQSTLNQKSYAKLIQIDNDRLIDDLEAGRKDRAEEQESLRTQDWQFNAPKAKLALSGRGGAFGGGAGGVMSRQANDSLMARGLAAPAPTAMADKSEAAAAAEPSAQEPAVQVRTDFRSTIAWQPDVVTDSSGRATVRVKYPDSLTGWKAVARAVSRGNEFGIDATSTRTKQPLMVRLQAPRFFVAGDTVTLSAVVNNNTDEACDVKLAFEYTGNALQLKGTSTKTVSVAANGETRADWLAEVTGSGEAKLKVTGRSNKHSDAMEKSYTCYEHGIEKFLGASGKVRENDFTIKFDLPRERKAGSTTLTVQVTPSMAVTMLDALPYLIRYPYGCTEQTMSRFLPAAITAKTLKDLDLQPEDVMSRVFGGIEQAQAGATHPDGKKDLAELNKIIKAGLERLTDFNHADGGWGWWKEGESDRWMTAYVVWGLTVARAAGITAVDEEVAKSAGASAIDPNTGLPLPTLKGSLLERGANFLDSALVQEEENPDMQAWVLHALTAYNHSRNIGQLSPFQAQAFENLWKNRDQLNAYTRALLALCAHYSGRSEQARTLVQNLENGVKRDERPDRSILIQSGPTANPGGSGVIATAHWGEDGIYWRWSEGGVEATAFALRALLAIDPQNKLIEPVTNWLLKNRRGAQWNSTRDTAIVILALNDYLRASGELNADLEYELVVNGTSVAREKLSGADLLKAPSRFPIDSKLVKDSNEIRIKRKPGKAQVYFAVESKFFSLEEPIVPAGNEIFVKREYYKLVGRPTLLKGYVYEKQPLRDGDTVRSGERVETLITIEAKNNYEYLVFEDLKPAGFEAVEVRSGEPVFARELKSGAVDRKHGVASGTEAMSAKPSESLSGLVSRRIAGPQKVSVTRPPRPQPVPGEDDFTGRTRWVYQELRDRKVALFLDKLPEGVWEIRYDARAEVPGQFHALPVTGYAMYVPEIRANGAELRVKVVE